MVLGPWFGPSLWISAGISACVASIALAAGQQISFGFPIRLLFAFQSQLPDGLVRLVSSPLRENIIDFPKDSFLIFIFNK